jgi:hypothetical protein
VHGAELYLVIGALVLFAIGRQFLPQPVNDGRWWLIPAGLIVYGLFQMTRQPLPGLAASAALGVDIVISIVSGLLRGLTTRVWVGADGRTMKRGTLLTFACWVASFGARFGALALFHTGFDQPGLLIFLGVSFGIQAAVVQLKARGARGEAPTKKPLARSIL